MIELYLWLIFIIITALLAIETKDLLSSIVALGVTGLGMCMVFLILKAPDVAITQLIVEILCLIILVRATLKKDLPFSTTGRWFLNSAIALTFISVFLWITNLCFKDLPQFGYPLMRVSGDYLKEGIYQTGVANMVSAITLDYRVYDTLGEAIVLFTAVIGVITILRKTGKKKEKSESN